MSLLTVLKGHSFEPLSELVMEQLEPVMEQMVLNPFKYLKIVFDMSYINPI
jgi:hypothetical protein